MITLDKLKIGLKVRIDKLGKSASGEVVSIIKQDGSPIAIGVKENDNTISVLDGQEFFMALMISEIVE